MTFHPTEVVRCAALWAACLNVLQLLIASNCFGDTTTLPTVLGNQVKTVVVGPRANFSNKRLYGTQLVGENLNHADFTNADLRGALFLECDLSGAIFDNCSFIGSRFSDNIVSGASFVDAIINDAGPCGGNSHAYLFLTPVQLAQTLSFKEKDLHGVAFRRTSLGPDADLRKFDLRNATLLDEDFTDVLFDGAQITGTSFEGKVDFEQLRKTVEVSKGRFPAKYHAYFDVNFSKIDLRGASLSFQNDIKFDLSDANIDDCRIDMQPNEDNKAAIESTWSYKQGRLRSLGLSRADLSGISFDNMILEHVMFSSIKFTGASFRNTVIVWSDLNCHFDPPTAEQLRETYNAKHGHLTEIRFLPEQLKVDLEVGN